MNELSVKYVELVGIHRRYNFSIKLDPSLNILHGQNGTGKSTLIHVIANIANCDFIRFAFLDFESIYLVYYNQESIMIYQNVIEGDKIIEVIPTSGESLVFTAREAQECMREMEDERYNREIVPELLLKINRFIKINDIQKIDTSYFPAFRTMLEAWSSQVELRRSPSFRRHRDNYARKTTSFSRDLFGQFLPVINYPSPAFIERDLRDEIRECQINIARYESSVFSDSFVKVFSALLENDEEQNDADEILSEISELTKETIFSKFDGEGESTSDAYRQLQDLVSNNSRSRESQRSAAGALAVYRDALKERQKFQRHAFNEIDTYVDIVNSFLENKELAYTLGDKKINRVGLQFPDGTWSSIKVMSSGERQLLTMLYAVNKLSGKAIVLIDEPEISLHIDWQEDLLQKMMGQLGSRQIIVCTHSPAIASDYSDYMVEVTPLFYDFNFHGETSDFLVDDEDDY